jgi:hypothetical protein
LPRATRRCRTHRQRDLPCRRSHRSLDVFRNDLAFAAFPSIPKNPHTFLTNIASPAAAPLALGAQAQIATFFESDGTVIDPDGAAPIFKVPIAGPLPEALNFLP